MTTSLFDAVNASGTTTNGAVTNNSSLNKNVDLFFLIGSSRGKDITTTFAGAFAEDPDVATRVLQWARDARGGAGERDQFRNLFGYLIRNDVDVARRVLVKIPELGRWDDLLITVGTPLEADAFGLIQKALMVDTNGLCAKWMPRQGAVAAKLRAFMKMSPKQYRKTLVALSDTVEQKMCANDWSSIEYSKLPSVAAARYQRAFGKRDPHRYAEYKAKLATGEAKINAAAVYPYDVIRSIRNGDKAVANAQWKALPDYMKGSDESVIPVVDVSGSMTIPVSGSVAALDVAVSLGLYLSERSRGIFQDQFITFSSRPRMVKVTGSLSQRLDQMESSDWGMSTNLQAVFELILDSAVRHRVDAKDMPSKILILSDMEFNQCVHGGQSVSAIDMIQKKYAAAGYTAPQVVFWNLNGRKGNMPVTYDQVGTALVSGFSPSIVKSVLGVEDLMPLNVMLDTVMIERYDF